MTLVGSDSDSFEGVSGGKVTALRGVVPQSVSPAAPSEAPFAAIGDSRLRFAARASFYMALLLVIFLGSQLFLKYGIAYSSFDFSSKMSAGYVEPESGLTSGWWVLILLGVLTSIGALYVFFPQPVLIPIGVLMLGCYLGTGSALLSPDWGVVGAVPFGVDESVVLWLSSNEGLSFAGDMKPANLVMRGELAEFTAEDGSVVRARFVGDGDGRYTLERASSSGE